MGKRGGLLAVAVAVALVAVGLLRGDPPAPEAPEASRRVLGPDGSPRAGLVVRSTPSKPAKAAGSVAETPSDAEGRYAVRVTPGENRVEVVDPATGRTVHEQEVDADDRETTLDLPVE